MHWILGMIATALLLGGCGPSHQELLRAEVQKVHDTDMVRCTEQHPDRFRKPATLRVKCVNDANIKLATDGRDPNIDLVQTLAAHMLAVAERYDDGKLTKAQFDAERTAAFSDFRTRMLQRENSATIADAATRTAAAAQQQAITSSIPRTVTCNRFGNTVTCY